MDTTIQSNLLPGEEILWQGQPQIARGINLSSIFSSIFGIFWLVFSLFWTTAAFLGTRNINSTDPTGSLLKIFFPLFGLPFVAIGIFMVFVAPLKQRAKNKSIFYYVTNKRVIINIETKSPVLNSVLIEDIQSVQIMQNRDNTGNIIFPTFFTSQSKLQMKRSTNTDDLPAPDNCFYRIENANDIHKLILMHQEIATLKENNQ